MATTSGGLRKHSVQLSFEQFEKLSGIAEERQVSIAAIIRDAIREYLARASGLAQVAA